jgi:phage tail sheath protein FI
MPVTVNYPGVYIEEIPSGVRTITGVATSITAFLGGAPRGPTADPVIINSFADYERLFGGVDANYPLSYAVQGFFQNGGAQAIIVRLYKAGAAAGTAAGTVGTLKLEAASQGDWGNLLAAGVDADGITDEIAAQYGLTKADLFNLTVQSDPKNQGPKEVYRNVSVAEGPRKIDRVLAQQSGLVRIPLKAGTTDPDLPGSAPGAAPLDPKNPTFFTGGAKSDPLDSAAYKGSESKKTGMYQLLKTDLFNLLCIPPAARGGDTAVDVYQEALSLCVKRRAMLLVDPPGAWSAGGAMGITQGTQGKIDALNIAGTDARNAALYYPRVVQPDPARAGQLDTFVPSGIIAGIMARTDSQRGVWKAPAGLDAALNGVMGLDVVLSDGENGQLNPLAINCLRAFPGSGRVVWGARTMRGGDQAADEYKYVPVRRLALYLEESLYRGLKWVVFEPNDEPLWAQIRLNVGAFMHNLFRQGAFQGTTPRDAYFVKCDKETTTQNDIDLGIVNIVVGFAPLKPAEFVILKLQQMAGQIEV